MTLLASLRTLQIMRQEQGEGANDHHFSNFEFLRDERGKRRVTSGRTSGLSLVVDYSGPTQSSRIEAAGKYQVPLCAPIGKLLISWRR